MKIKRGVLLVICFILSFISYANAEISAPTEAGYAENYKNVYIEGKTDSTLEPYVSVCLTKDGQIKYIRQVNVNADGSYSLKFKYNDTIEGCSLAVKEGGRDINSSVKTSIIEAYMPIVTLELINEKNNWYFTSDSEITANLEIENKYADKNCSFDIIAAYYDANGKLIGFKAYERNIESSDVYSAMKQPLPSVPENAAAVRAYVWASLCEMIPVSNTETKDIGKYIFGSSGEDVTVAVVGDSLTQHLNSYKTALEHYYMTRYPERNIKFVNKGIGGEGVPSLSSRFEYDIMDCEGKKPDAAIVMIGMNDNGYNYYNDYKNKGATEWHYNGFCKNFPVLIDLFIKNNIPVVIASPSLYDENDNAELTGTNYSCSEYGANRTGLKRISEFQKSIADEKGVPYIPINEITSELDKRIRNENPNVGTLFTGSDRIHPTSAGAMFVGYLFAESGVGSADVSEVSIDVSKKSIFAKSASAKNVQISENEISYDYKPGSLPLAANDDYLKIENEFGYKLSEKLNREIIKVSGLSAGTYEIIFDGKNIIGEYSDEELKNGVNIAKSENNPSQAASRAAYAKLLKKDKISDIERSYVKSLIKLHNNNVDINDESAVKACLGENSYNYFIGVRDLSEQRKADIISLRAEAKSLSSPSEHSVTIIKK